MLNFFNKGEIDPRLITTMGVNVKEGDNPIGFFGTGLKYAIACVLRTGGTIEIHSGSTTFKFEKRTEEIRGKDFDLVYMNGVALGFTTELGKQWEPWMWYRELASNAKDEGGTIRRVGSVGEPAEGWTNIYVEGLDEQYTRRSEVFLESVAIYSSDSLELHLKGAGGGDEAIYYRGIRVGKLDKPGLFTYNIKERIDLTEDRTIKYSWVPGEIVGRFIARLEDRELIRSFLLAKDDGFEAGVDLNYQYNADVMDEVIAECLEKNLGTINASAVRRALRLKKKTDPREAIVSGAEALVVETAKDFVKKAFGFDIGKVIVAEGLGTGVHGLAFMGKVYIAREAIARGPKWVAMVLVEEWAHVDFEMIDFTRSFQTWLLERLVTTGEEKLGVVLGAIVSVQPEPSIVSITMEDMPF